MTCEEKFQVNVDLYNEFKLYSFDSAFHYATQLCRIANDIDSSAYRVDARTRLGYILARGGFFNVFTTIWQIILRTMCFHPGIIK